MVSLSTFFIVSTYSIDGSKSSYAVLQTLLPGTRMRNRLVMPYFDSGRSSPSALAVNESKEKLEYTRRIQHSLYSYITNKYKTQTQTHSYKTVTHLEAIPISIYFFHKRHSFNFLNILFHMTNNQHNIQKRLYGIQ